MKKTSKAERIAPYVAVKHVQGKRTKDLAEVYGVSESTIRKAIKLVFQSEGTKLRNEFVAAAHMNGMNFSEIGRLLNISRIRVRQIYVASL